MKKVIKKTMLAACVIGLTIGATTLFSTKTAAETSAPESKEVFLDDTKLPMTGVSNSINQLALIGGVILVGSIGGIAYKNRRR